MSFAQSGQLLVSRSFYEVVSCLSRDYASLFRHEGARTDKHVRDHEVYSVGGSPSMRRLSETHSQTGSHGTLSYWIRGIGPLGLRRSALLIAPLVVLVLLAGGFAARALFATPTPAPAPQAAASSPKAAPTPQPVAAPEKAAPTAEKAATAPKKQAVASVDKKPEKAKPASGAAKLELVVTPWGEVLIDGKSRGISTGRRAFELPPGPHTIEIRNTGSPSHVQKVQVKAGETVRIQHRFK
jgi:hypothetical protein